MPIVVLANMLMPTVDKINKGPELFVKLSNLSHSILEQILFSLKLVTIFAPKGYPLIKPIIKQNAPFPLMLKIGFINLLNNLSKRKTILVCINKLVATKKGNNEGTTVVAHKVSPFLTAIKLVLVNISSKKEKDKKIKVKKFFLEKIRKKCFFICIYITIK